MLKTRVNELAPSSALLLPKLVLASFDSPEFSPQSKSRIAGPGKARVARLRAVVQVLLESEPFRFPDFSP